MGGVYTHAQIRKWSGGISSYGFFFYESEDEIDDWEHWESSDFKKGRKRCSCVFVIGALMGKRVIHSEREIWSKERSSDWNRIVPQFTPEEWKENLRPELHKRSIVMRTPMPTLFGVSPRTCIIAVYCTCTVHKTLRFVLVQPSSRSTKRIVLMMFYVCVLLSYKCLRC